MPEIYLSDSDDIYVQPIDEKDLGNNIWGKAGNDTIRVYNGNVLGGPGNDTIELIPIPNEPWRQVTAAYWDNPPGKIVVDLEAGWAQDGWGGIDKLINVRSAAGGWGETEFYGSSKDNMFFVGGGKTSIDGRAGFDTLWLPGFSSTPPKWADFNIKVSIDGSSAVITSPLNNNFKLSISNIEALIVWNGSNQEQKTLSTFINPQDIAIDGLIHSPSTRWNASSPMGTPVEVTFSFVKQAPANGVGANQFRAFTTNEQTTVREILLNLSQLTGLSFREVDESTGSTGSIRFGASQQTATKGVTYLPGQNGDAAGDIWMDLDSLINLTPGSEGYAALLHEIGHALGLRHTRNVDPSDHYTLQVIPDYDLTSLTVMSQNASSDGLFPSSFGALDVAALRSLYGSKPVRTGDDNYMLGSGQFLSESTLVDDGGVNTLNASLAKAGVSLDLIPGHLSSVGVTANGILGTNNLAIALGTNIHNAIGSDFDDVLQGNDLDNQLTGGNGNDWIDGGKGVDTAIFVGARSDYFISTGFGKIFLAARDGTSGFDTLLNVEKLRFDDQAITLGSAALGSDLEISMDQGQVASGQLPSPSDLTRQQVQYQINTKPAHGDITLDSAGNYVYTPNPTFSSNDIFTYNLIDANKNTNTYVAYVHVNAVAPTVPYTVLPDMLKVDEGGSINFYVYTNGVPAGTVVYYSLSGVSADDINGGKLSGTVTIDSSGTTVLTVGLVADRLTEGNESLSVKISLTADGAAVASSAVVVINDTSLTPPLRLDGTANADQLLGAAGNDTINGNAGNDTITGAGGNDVVNGGDGFDIAAFSGPLKNYQVTRTGTSTTVKDKTGTDGTDSLTNIENLRFSDLSINLGIKSLVSSSPQATVQRLMELYIAFFNRVPDADGLAYWIGAMNSGQQLNQIADSFYNIGIEYSNLTGFSSTMSNTDFINVVYKNVLGRADGADPGGLDYWGAKLASGSATRGSLVSTILDAAHGFKGDSTWGWVANLLDNKLTVAKTFAIDWGLTYNTPTESTTKGMAIAAAVTPSNINEALGLIGISPSDLSL